MVNVSFYNGSTGDLVRELLRNGAQIDQENPHFVEYVRYAYSIKIFISVSL